MNKLMLESKFSPGKIVTAAQYIAEIVCENNCKKNGQELPLRFWTLPDWKKFYIFQIKCCNDLLKLVDEEILLKFVRERNIWNLSPQWVVENLEKLQRIHLAQNKIKAREKIEMREREYVESSIGLSNRDMNLTYLD